MIDSVAGGMTLARPTPFTKKSAAIAHIGVVGVTRLNPAITAAVSSMPTVLTAFGPNRRTIAELPGANTICATANGVMSRPALNGLSPRTSCR